jgi:hypothetical protein
MYVFQSPACGEKAASCMLAAWSLIVLHLVRAADVWFVKNAALSQAKPKSSAKPGAKLCETVTAGGRLDDAPNMV